jgi:CheY-like chemotaxis protein
MTEALAPWVLIVDDDEDIRDSIQSLLQLRGYTVDTAPDGASALARMRSGPPPALVILDFMMPRMNGEEFRAAQLGDATIAAVPVIVLSGAGKLQERAALAGVSVVAKPIELDELFAMVERVWTEP